MAITAIVPLHFGLVVRCAYCSPMQPGTNKWVYLVHLLQQTSPALFSQSRPHIVLQIWLILFRQIV
jgi:hypothetical protein